MCPLDVRMREDHSRPVLTQPEKLLHARELLSEIIPCLVRHLARFKREQGQTETDDLEEHSMQRGLIRQRPREQRRPGLLLLDAESAKAVLPGRAQVSLDTYRVVHLPPPHAVRFTPERRAWKGDHWKITIVFSPLWEKHSGTRAIPKPSKVCQKKK